jgi:hypothetical protein
MRRALLFCILFSNALASQAATPDNAEGKKLHDARCLSCHNASVYTRKDRQIKSLSALREQLSACAHAGQVTLNDEEQVRIVNYLNEQFYKFK